MMLFIYIICTVSILAGIAFSIWTYIDTNRRYSSHGRRHDGDAK